MLPWAYQGGEGRVPCVLIWKAVHVRLLLSTRVRSYGSEEQGWEILGFPGTLGGPLLRFMSGHMGKICVVFSCFHPLWPGFCLGLVLAPILRYHLLPECFGGSPPPP